MTDGDPAKFDVRERREEHGPPVLWSNRAHVGSYSVRLDIEADSGLVLATATGFFLKDYGAQLVTARHCVTGVHQETGELLGDGYPATVAVHLRPFDGVSEDVVGRIRLFDEDGRPEWSEHPEFGPSADVVPLPVGALLTPDPGNPELAPPGIRGDMFLLEASPILGFLPRGVVDLAELAEQSRVVVIGFRAGAADHDVAFEAVEAVLVATRDSDRADLPRFQCAGDTGPGMSGSPVYLLSEDGRRAALVGMYSGRTPTGHAEFLDRDALAKTVLLGTRPTHPHLARAHRPGSPVKVALPGRISGPPMRISRETEEPTD